MFGLGKKQKKLKDNQLASSELDSQISEQVHVMPERFYHAPKKRHTGLILIIVVGTILIGGLVAAGYFLNQSLNQPGAEPPANTNLNQPVNQVNSNQPVFCPQDVKICPDGTTVSRVEPNCAFAPCPVVVATSTPNTTPTSTPTTTDDVVNTNQNTNTNTNNSGQVVPAPDIDGDSLSAAEEILYGTDSVNRDSDGDGFADGSEILNGYDPRQAGKNLADSTLFSTYTKSGYSIIYPSRWRLRELAGVETEAIFQSTSGEFVEVLILANPNKLTLSQWYQQQFPEQSLRELTAVKINGLDGFLSADQLNYYLADPQDSSQVYLITYNVGNSSQANFLTTFNVMVKNFFLTP